MERSSYFNEKTILTTVGLKCILLAVVAGITAYLTGSHIAVILLIFVIINSLPVCIYVSRNIIKKIETAEKDLERQGKLLEVVKETSEILLASESADLGKSLVTAMGHMARCVNADRMYIWHNQIIDGRLCYEKQYEWVDDVIRDTHARPEGNSYYFDTIPQWDTPFATGKHVNGPVSSLSKAEQDVLSKFQIRSILVIPLFPQQKFWGFVSFDDLHLERTFLENEITILRTASLLLANAVILKQNRTMIENQIEQQKLMTSISRNFVSKEPIYNLITKTLGDIGTFLKTSKILIVTTGKESGEAMVEYFWAASEKWKPADIGQGINETIKAFFPAVIPETGVINAICCNDIYSEFGGKFHFFEVMGAKSIIVAPIYLEGSFWGFLSVEECEAKRTWTESDIQLVGAVTSSVSAAISRNLIDKARAAALQQAVQASMAKGNFLATMSHEMRTPMNAIIGMTSIGKAANNKAKKDYAFEKIENASSHLLGVINDILDISKIEANKFELSPVTFNFEKVLEKVVNVTGFRIDERNQEFTVQIDDKIPRFIVGDDQRIAQVITNLLSNAVKFTPENGSIALNARLHDKKDDVYILLIEVKDSGIGISKEQQIRLFDSFEQADSGTSRKFGGTGLGLAISKSIVRLMGGEIWVESEPGKGSSFSFTIRVKKGCGVSQGMLAPGVSIKNIRILAVDDNPDILEYFASIMARFEINCDIASSGEAALSNIESKGAYNLYFVDWRMPGMDGIELSRRIKADCSGRAENPEEAVIIMISSYEWTMIEAEARKAGVDKFLPKPLFPSAIVDVINECLGSSGVKETLKEQAAGEMESMEDFTVLLAEDVEINREIFFTLLAPTALNIEIAENGREAVEKFTAAPEKYSMIFMDIQMPEMDGYEATRQIRAFEKDRKKELPEAIPIVAMTANVFREDIEKCLAAGMNDHTGKPLDINEIIDVLKKYLPKPTTPP